MFEGATCLNAISARVFLAPVCARQFLEDNFASMMSYFVMSIVWDEASGTKCRRKKLTAFVKNAAEEPGEGWELSGASRRVRLRAVSLRTV